MFPKKIIFLTDDKEAEFVKECKTSSKVDLAYYKFTRSKTKLGVEHPFELSYIKRLERDGIIKTENA